jgi:hypothetical protein
VPVECADLDGMSIWSFLSLGILGGIHLTGLLALIWCAK